MISVIYAEIGYPQSIFIVQNICEPQYAGFIKYTLKREN